MADQRGWKVIVEIAPDKPENTADIEKLLRPAKTPGRVSGGGSPTQDRKQRNRRKKSRKYGARKSGLTVLQAARAEANGDPDYQAREAMFDKSARIASDLVQPDAEVRRGTPPGFALASTVIEELAQPLIDEIEPGNIVGMHTALMFACAVWNAAVHTDGNVEDALRELATVFRPTGMELSMLKSAEELLHRKNRLFSDDTRRFINVEVEPLPSGALHIVAVAAYEPDVWE